MARSISSDAALLSISGQTIIDGGGLLPGFERLECLWRSVEAIKLWLDAFYRIPPSECVGLPFHFWSQVIRCTTILKYLSTLEDPAWDRQAVRNRVNLLSVLDWMTKKLDLISREAGLQSNDDLFKLLSKLLSGSRVWAQANWDMPLPSQMQDQEAAAASPPSADHWATGTHNDMPDLDHMAWMQSMDLESDEWFQEVTAGLLRLLFSYATSTIYITNRQFLLFHSSVRSYLTTT